MTRRRPGLRNLPRLWLAVVLLVLGSGTVFSGSIPPADAASPSTWVQATSVPQPGGNNGQYLLDVSCANTSQCVAVGYSNASGQAYTNNEVLVSTNGGATWTAPASPVPQPGGTNGQQLNGVSCASTASSIDCVAVGYYYDPTGSFTYNEVFVSTDGGTTWTAPTLTSAAQPGGSNGQQLNGVSCASTTACVAVGYYYDTYGNTYNEVLVSADGGTTWTAPTLTSAAQPGGSNGDELNGVSCASTTYCVAVGYYVALSGTTHFANYNEVLVSTNGGTTWTAPTSTSVPQPGVIPGQQLNGVSCASTTYCVAVGYYNYSLNGGTDNEVLVSTDGGSIWTAPTLTQPEVGGYQYLYGVSCASSSDCVAVGLYDVSGGQDNLVWVSADGGTTWTSATTVAQPAAGSSFPYQSLNGVACASTSDCVAVGNYFNEVNGSHVSQNEALLTLTAPTLTTISPAAAFAGTSVALSGSDFGTVTGSVYFTQGGTSSPVPGGSWSDTGASAVVPSGLSPGSVTVAVYNYTTGLLSNTVSFTVSEPPASGSLSVSPGRVTANGTSYSTVTATFYDEYSNPVPGATVTFTIISGPGTLATRTVSTNVYGVAADTITSTTAGTATVAAFTNGVLGGRATVTFTPVPGPTGGSTSTTTVTTTSTDTSAAGSLGATGGTLATLNNAMVLTVPAGAFSGPVNITATAEAPSTAPPPPSGCTAAAVWSFDTGGAEPTTPVTVSFSFSPTLLSSGLSASRLGVYYYDTGTASWSWVGGTVNTTTDTITVSLPHLSTYGVLVNTTVFNDLAGYDWASPSINALLGADVINGVSAGVFDPSGTVTRAQFATMLVSADELTPVASGVTPFSDVPATSAYAPYIAAAYNAGLILGVTPTSFEPNAPITRAQMAVILARLLASSPTSTATLTQFKDASAIARWAQPSIAAVVSSGLMNGFPDGTFRSTGTSTRAQAAVVVARYLTHIGKL